MRKLGGNIMTTADSIRNAYIELQMIRLAFLAGCEPNFELINETIEQLEKSFPTTLAGINGAWKP
jgi:hypothetical protein